MLVCYLVWMSLRIIIFNVVSKFCKCMRDVVLCLKDCVDFFIILDNCFGVSFSFFNWVLKGRRIFLYICCFVLNDVCSILFLIVCVFNIKLLVDGFDLIN